MTVTEDQEWENALHDACFPVTLADVHVGDPPRRAKRYRAVVPVEAGIVSIRAPEVDLDLRTEVANQIGVAVEIEV